MALAQRDEIKELSKQIACVRSELKNLRQSIVTLKKNEEREFCALRSQLHECQLVDAGERQKPRVIMSSESKVGDCHGTSMKPITYMESIFKQKNGTPRQSGVCPMSRGKFTIAKTVFNNPSHSLQGLQEYSHIWILFLFHKNGTTAYHAKVRPPRMNGQKTGVFATRSPHRPNNIGLSLAKIERIEGATVYLSGIDIIDGTPILDIKPYIPNYDKPMCVITKADDVTQDMNDTVNVTDGEILVPETKGVHTSDEGKNVILSESSSIADWVAESTGTDVRFTETARLQCEQFSSEADSPFQLDLLTNAVQLQRAITDILHADPRSVYRREKCADRLYYFTVDNVHVTAWFDANVTEVVRIQPTTHALT